MGNTVPKQIGTDPRYSAINKKKKPRGFIAVHLAFSFPFPIPPVSHFNLDAGV
jgi:hypothetical protein